MHDEVQQCKAAAEGNRSQTIFDTGPKHQLLQLTILVLEVDYDSISLNYIDNTIWPASARLVWSNVCVQSGCLGK